MKYIFNDLYNQKINNEYQNYEIQQILRNTPLKYSILVKNVLNKNYYLIKSYKVWSIKNNLNKNKIQFANNNYLLYPIETLNNEYMLTFKFEFFLLGNLYDLIIAKKRIEIMSLNSLISLTIQLLSIIEEIHNKNKLLLCLKPENIFFKNNKTIFLRIITDQKIKMFLKDSKIFNEIIEYMSPEMISLSIVDKGTDFWQLGLLMFYKKI